MYNKRKAVDVDKALEFYNSGMTLAEVAEKFDVSGYCIRKRFLEAGIPRRKTGTKNGGVVKRTQPPRICACCGIMPVPEKPVDGVKLTRLCLSCYQNGENRRVDL